MSARQLTSRFTSAVAGAARIHGAQVRKGTDIPYIAHLLAVASIALEHGATEDEAIAALLHDAIEDAPKEQGAAQGVRAWIRSEFGQPVLDIVEGCTDTDVPDKPEWRPRKVEYIEHLKSAPASVVLVSASDKLHNARAILRDYRHIGDELWSRFKATAGKTDVVGYYRGLVSVLTATGSHPRLVDELDRVVTELEAETGVRGTWPPR